MAKSDNLGYLQTATSRYQHTICHMLRLTTRAIGTCSASLITTGSTSTVFKAYEVAKPVCGVYKRFIMSDATSGRPLEILLVGLGSIGSVYAHILEKVRQTISTRMLVLLALC